MIAVSVLNKSVCVNEFVFKNSGTLSVLGFRLAAVAGADMEHLSLDAAAAGEESPSRAATPPEIGLLPRDAPRHSVMTYVADDNAETPAEESTAAGGARGADVLVLNDSALADDNPGETSGDVLMLSPGATDKAPAPMPPWLEVASPSGSAGFDEDVSPGPLRAQREHGQGRPAPAGMVFDDDDNWDDSPGARPDEHDLDEDTRMLRRVLSSHGRQYGSG